MSNGGGIGDDKEDTNLVGSSFSLVRSLLLISYQVRYNNPVLIDKHPETPSPAPGAGPVPASDKDGKGKKGKGGGDGEYHFL